MTGALSSAVHALVFVTLGALSDLDVQMVHLAATTVSTVVANELHRSFTFGAPGRVAGPRIRSAGAAMAVLGWVATSTTLAMWNRLMPDSGPVLPLLAVYTVSALVGVCTFLVLRWTTRSPLRPAEAHAPAAYVEAPTS